LLAVGLAVMLLAGGALSFQVAVISDFQFDRKARYEGWIDTPEKRERLVAELRKASPTGAEPRKVRVGRLTYQLSADSREKAIAALSDERYGETAAALQRLTQTEAAGVDEMKQRLNRPEAALLRTIDEQMNAEEDDRSDEQRAFILAQRIALAMNPPPDHATIPWVVFTGLFVSFLVLMLVWPLVVWPICAVLFRGGVAYWFAGLTLVKRDGRKAGRLLCGLRELLVWLPFTLLLFLSLFVQWQTPTWVVFRTGCWLLAVALLPLMIVIALRDPVRGPHDRLLGLRLVPV
jgi:hypothetical protein